MGVHQEAKARIWKEAKRGFLRVFNLKPIWKEVGKDLVPVRIWKDFSSVDHMDLEGGGVTSFELVLWEAVDILKEFIKKPSGRKI